MPRVEDLLEHMGSASFFFTLDLQKGYYQVPVNHNDVPKTAFVTQFGKISVPGNAIWTKKCTSNVPMFDDNILQDTTEFAFRRY